MGQKPEALCLLGKLALVPLFASAIERGQEPESHIEIKILISGQMLINVKVINHSSFSEQMLKNVDIWKF